MGGAGGVTDPPKHSSDPPKKGLDPPRKNTDLISSLSCFDATSKNFLVFEEVEKFADKYESLITTSIRENLESELVTAKKYLASMDDVNKLPNLYEKLIILPSSFKCLIKLIKIAITLPVSTASNERFK